MLLTSFSSFLAAESLSAGVRVAVDVGLAGVTDLDEGGDDDGKVLHVSWLAMVSRSAGWMFPKPR